MKKVYRSDTNRVFAGILGGLGEYFDVDPVLFRLIWIFVTIFTGLVPGILIYILAIFVVPQARIIVQEAEFSGETGENSK